MTRVEATFVQGDTAPSIVAQLHDVLDPTKPLDLSQATSVRFQMRKPDDRLFQVDAEASITNESQGLVLYSWSATDLGVDGEYDAQWEVHWNDGKIQTVETPNRINVRRK